MKSFKHQGSSDNSSRATLALSLRNNYATRLTRLDGKALRDGHVVTMKSWEGMRRTSTPIFAWKIHGSDEHLAMLEKSQVTHVSRNATPVRSRQVTCPPRPTVAFVIRCRRFEPTPERSWPAYKKAQSTFVRFSGRGETIAPGRSRYIPPHNGYYRRPTISSCCRIVITGICPLKHLSTAPAVHTQ